MSEIQEKLDQQINSKVSRGTKHLLGEAAKQFGTSESDLVRKFVLQGLKQPLPENNQTALLISAVTLLIVSFDPKAKADVVRSLVQQVLLNNDWSPLK